MNNWRNGNEIGKLYKIYESDLRRIGSCWMNGRLKVADIVLCIAHTGDCFNDYFLIDTFFNGIKLIRESRFSAYILGKETNWQPTNK